MGKSGDAPYVVVLAGPNGAGKSTVAPWVLHRMLGLTEFVNADTIARGLSGFSPEHAALDASAAMLSRLHQLAGQRANFAFETTLASRTPAAWLRNLIADGYRVHLVFLWLPSATMAVRRVARRVRSGGHAVPEDVIRRRYSRGLQNFFRLYQPLATTWQILDNSVEPPAMIAAGRTSTVDIILDRVIWLGISGEYA